MSPLWSALLVGAALAEDPAPAEPVPAEPVPAEPAPEDAPPVDPARDEDALFGGGERDEDALFGGGGDTAGAAAPGGEDATAPSPPPGGDRDRVLDRPSAPSDASILARLAEVDDRLAIGGLVYSRLDYAYAQDQDLETSTLSAPTLLDLYADVRANDRLRAYARGRVKHDFTVAAGDTDFLGNEKVPTSALLDQLWFKFDVARKVYLTVGQQRVKWGAGRFWNPTDFLNQQVLDPLAVFDERTGVGLVRAHVPFEAAGMNVYAVANLDGADHPDQVGGALRVEWLVGNTELSATAAARKDQPLRLGADLNTGIAFFDLRVEAAVQHGGSPVRWEGTFDIETFTFPTEVSRSEDWIPQVVAAVEVPIKFGDEDSLTVGVEGFYNDAGYADADLYPWLVFNGGYQPLYLGRMYVGGYAYLPGPGRWNDHTFTASVLSNVSDGTGVARLDWRATVLTRLSVNAYGSAYFGEPGGEFRFALDIPPVAGVDGLEDGITVAPPVFGAGLGLTLAF